jgi:hypothetical protein
MHERFSGVDMMWQDIAITLLGIITAVGGWLLRTLWDAVQDMKKDLHVLETDIRTSFARRDDVREMFSELRAGVLRIEAKLDNKADKMGPY